MKPIFQDKFGADPDNLNPETTGNCFQSCVASILELPIADVPHFVVEPGNWFLNFERWARDRGFWIAMVDGPIVPAVFAGFAIANGISPRDTQHSVVYQGEELAHDPNPAGGGLAKVESFYYFIPIDPAVQGRTLAALRMARDVLDDTNAAACTDGPICVWCHEQGYDGDGLKHKSDCLLVALRELLS